MTTEQYLSYFFPFDELDFVKRSVESSWSVSKPTLAALVITMSDRPQAVLFGGIAQTYHMEIRPNTVFCSGQCKNQYNVYKSREKSREENLADGE